MKKEIITLVTMAASFTMAACTNSQDQMGAAKDNAPTSMKMPNTDRGSMGGSTNNGTNNPDKALMKTTTTSNGGTPAGSDVDPNSLKPSAEHSDFAGNTNDASAFNRPAGNSLRSAINGDGNNPKNTVVAQGQPDSVGAVILQQMLSKDDEYNSRIATIKEHQDALAPDQRKLVSQGLKEASQEKQSFDKLLGQLKEDSNNGKLKNRLNVASAKVDRCLRKLELRVK